jgi:hypothetical protein
MNNDPFVFLVPKVIFSIYWEIPMKINITEILISLMIIVFIGFVLFFVASHLAKKKINLNDENAQIPEKTVPDKDVPKSKSQLIPQQIKPQPESTKTVSQEEKPTKTVETIKNIAKKSNQSKPMPKRPPPVRKTIQKDKIIQFETVRDNEQHPDHSLMDERKKTFGLNKSLDLIVKPDEKVQVGDSVAPIKRISERLQLEQGKLIEDIIDEPFQMPENVNTSQSRSNSTVIQEHKKLKEDPLFTKKRKAKALHKPFPSSIPIELDTPENPSDDQNKLIPGYPYISESETQIKKLIKTISEKKQKELKKLSIGDISPETNMDTYPPQGPKPYEKNTYLGIRVVQPNTNIWEIHFDLLKEYFQHKGVTLSPHADEPKKSGESSGVGKILKFSEQLVNIYNLKTQTFEHNLNEIQPLSVIVIYNMSQIFGVLDDIDYSVIDRIEFDGESLWIPSH